MSQLRIVDPVGTDPVSDKLLFNSIRFVTEWPGCEDRPHTYITGLQSTDS